MTKAMRISTGIRWGLYSVLSEGSAALHGSFKCIENAGLAKWIVVNQGAKLYFLDSLLTYKKSFCP